MGRAAHHQHWATGEVKDLGHRQAKVTLCKSDHWHITCAADVAQVTCPKCAAILAQQALAAYHADPANPKLELQPTPEGENPGSYRFAYRALLGGEHYGYIVYDGAYANAAWCITEIRIDEKDSSIRTGAHVDSEGTVSRFRSKGLEYVVKDFALLAIPALVAAKRLETVAQTKRHLAEWQARRTEREAERQREEAEQQARRTEREAERQREQAEQQRNQADARAALIEIRDTVTLTNFQRSGVEFAISQFTPKDDA